MKIKGTEWYTAAEPNCTPIEGSERVLVGMLYGYRMPVKEDEIEARVATLRAEGVKEVKSKVSSDSYQGIPAGTHFLEVFDEESVITLEKKLLEKGCELLPDRYKEHGLGYINRTPKQVSSVVQKSLWERLFGRK